MTRRTIRATLAALALAALPAVTAAGAEVISPADAAPPARVEYRYLGQGAYVMVMPTTPRRATEPSYALTGRRTVDGAWAAPGRVVNTGQGRYIVPAPAAR